MRKSRPGRRRHMGKRTDADAATTLAEESSIGGRQMRDLDARFKQLATPPVFVVGVPRSGTSWVGDIFAAHPLVTYVHESFLVSHGLAHLFGDLHFPGAYSGLGFTISRTEVIRLPAELARRIWSRKIQPQHRFFVEKSPKHLLHMPLIREMVPGAKFIL